MLKKAAALALALGLLAVPVLAEQVQLKHADQPYTIEVLESDLARTVLQYEINAFDMNAVDIAGREYSLLDLDGRARHMVAGMPELPTLRESIVIPDDAIAQLPEQVGGLKGAWARLSDTLREDYQDASEKAGKLYKTSSERLKEAVESAKEKSQEVSKSIGEKVEDAREKVQETVHDLTEGEDAEEAPAADEPAEDADADSSADDGCAEDADETAEAPEQADEAADTDAETPEADEE